MFNIGRRYVTANEASTKMKLLTSYILEILYGFLQHIRYKKDKQEAPTTKDWEPGSQSTPHKKGMFWRAMIFNLQSFSCSKVTVAPYRLTCHFFIHVPCHHFKTCPLLLKHLFPLYLFHHSIKTQQ